MKNQKTTKKALLSSVLSLVLCFTMLIGTTFAWFTDSVTSANNIIKSGNLDVELEYSTDMATWNKVTSETNIFKDGALWEPGYAEVVYLKVSNLGSLALKYQLGVNVASETPGTNQAGQAFRLSEHIEYGVVENVSAKYEDRATAVAAVAGDSTALSVGYTKAGSLLAKEAGASEVPADVVALVVYMPETVGNEANHNGKDVPEIKLGLNLMATQYTYEEDSFDETYDTGAYLPIVYNAEELISALSDNKSVKLGNNIDLSGMDVTPIENYTGILNGAGYEISGLSTNLFAAVTDATIANVDIVANIDVEGTEEIAAIAEKAYGNVKVDNVTVSGDINVYQGSAFIRKVETGHTVITNSTSNANVTSKAQKAAGFICTIGEADVTIKDCVNNGAITANVTNPDGKNGEVYAGGFLAWNSNGKGTTVTLENCVNNGAITGIRITGGGSTVAVGGISAIAWGNFTTNLNNVTNNGVVTAENRAADHNAHAGGIIGMVNPNAIVNINGANSNGNVSASITNAANTSKVGNVGGVIGQLNNGKVTMGNIKIGDIEISATSNAASNYVGALVGNAAGSSKVIYDTETVTYSGALPHIGNKASSVKTSEIPSTEAELKTALEDGGEVVLADDIEVNNWTSIGVETAPFTGTLNGNGYTISGLDGAQGLFNYVSGATIEDVVLDVDMNGAPALAYEVLGGESNPTTISNVVINGSVKNAPAAMMKNARTTSANTSTSTEILIKNCTNNASVTSENINRASGFISTVFGANIVIDSCVNNGDMTVVSTTEAHAAGIAGYIMRNTNTTMPTLTVTDCVNNGDISGKSTSDGRANVGGIVATAHQGTTVIKNCVNNGNVSGEEAANKNQTCVGGIAGRVNSATELIGCTSKGNITAVATSDKAYAGGIVGMRNNSSTALTIDAGTVYTGTVTSNGTTVNKQIGNVD